MERKPNLDLKYSRNLSVFKEFLKGRKESINSDLKNISEKYHIPIERLETIKNSIREVLGGENIEYLSTTIHLRPRAIDYLLLGERRIAQAIEDESKIFHYPVYYQDFKDERPDLIYIGNYGFSLCEIIPALKEKKGNFETSLDFHQVLFQYLSQENWEDEMKGNLKAFINKEFANFKQKSRESLCENINQVVVSILEDYKNFFEQSKINEITSTIFEINQKLANVLLNNFETIESFLSEIGITEDYLKGIKEGRATIISSEFIFTICILGNLVHIGAEYGKFNEARERVGLKKIDEPEKPQERFRFFEAESVPGAESDTLRFLLGTPHINSFIYTAKYSGLEEAIWSPVGLEERQKIRVLDFYLNLKEIKQFIEGFSFSKEKFLNLLEEGQINYFTHLSKEEKQQVNEILKSLEDDQKKLKDWINSYNEKLKQRTFDNRFRIWYDALVKLTLLFIFKNYVEGKFGVIQDVLSSEIFEKIKGIEKIPKHSIKKKSLKEQPIFYGIQLPVRLLNLTKEDLINLVSLLEIQKKNLDRKSALDIFPKIN